MSRTFPIQATPDPWKELPVQIASIPWDLIAPHEAQALRNHCGQTLERLAQRGGLSPCEAVAVLEDIDYRKRWPKVILSGSDMVAHNTEAIKILADLLFLYQSNLDPNAYY